VGFQQAVDNTRELIETWKKQGRDIDDFEFALDVLQEPLFRMSELEADLMAGEIWYHGTGNGAGSRPVVIEDADGNMLGVLSHVSRHSPTGMSWGYAGSGPADTALSLLVAALGGDAKCRDCAGTRKIGWDKTVQADRPFDPARPGDFEAETVGACWCNDGYRHLPYQAFKFEFVAKWGPEWRMSRDEILRWVVTQPEWQEG
jgi:hypothetical protein